MNRLNPHFLRALCYLGGALLLLAGIGAVSWWLTRHRTSKAIERTVNSHAARVASVHAQSLASDSARYSLQGKRAELNRSLTLIRRLDDSLTRALPAAPELPAAPPR